MNIFNKELRSRASTPVTHTSEVQTKLGKFVILIAVIDSGATVPAMNQAISSGYKIVESSANGTEYEFADRDTPEKLGEKRMAVLTAEGSLARLHEQVRGGDEVLAGCESSCQRPAHRVLWLR